MENALLIQPTIAYAEEIAAYRAEFLRTGSSMDGCGPLRRIADPAEYLAEAERYTREEPLPP